MAPPLSPSPTAPSLPVAPDVSAQSGGAGDDSNALFGLVSEVGFFGTIGILAGVLVTLIIVCCAIWCCWTRRRQRDERRRFSLALRRENNAAANYRNFCSEIGSNSTAQPDFDLAAVSEKPEVIRRKRSTSRGSGVAFNALFEEGSELMPLPHSTPGAAGAAVAAGRAPPPPVLPYPWKVCTSDDGKRYFYNPETNESRWDPPSSTPPVTGTATPPPVTPNVFI